ncbi:MAG: transposase [Bacteroidia bacterium]
MKAIQFIQELVKTAMSNMKITPYGGAVPILRKIKEFGIPQVIRGCLGKRKEQSRYEYEDIFIAWILTTLCGGTRLDHITKLKKKLSIIPGLKLPSHDTLGRVMKQLATDSGSRGIVNKRSKANLKINTSVYNDNLAMNRMLVKATKRIGALQEGRAYTLDIDATFIATQCRGAESKHKKHGKHGFVPMVCLIGSLPVYISLRKGDSGARFMLLEALNTCLDLLAESNIKVSRVVSDAAGYSRVVTEMLEKRGIKFVMRFPVSGPMAGFKKNLLNADWRKAEIKTANDVWDCEIADVNYQMYYPKYKAQETMPLRVVAMRFPTGKTIIENESLDDRIQMNRMREKMHVLEKTKRLKQPGKKYTEIHWKRIGGYTYKFYVTNDFKKSSEEIIYEYNKRGDAERKFSYMKNDFAWRLPPFMWMNENNVFLIVASLANNIFVGMLRLLKKKIPNHINLKSRLKNFQFTFINVACVYVDRRYLFFDSDIDYQEVM